MAVELKKSTRRKMNRYSVAKRIKLTKIALQNGWRMDRDRPGPAGMYVYVAPDGEEFWTNLANCAPGDALGYAYERGELDSDFVPPTTAEGPEDGDTDVYDEGDEDDEEE